MRSIKKSIIKRKGGKDMSKQYHLFISHSWRYGDAYDKLSLLLRNKPYFTYSDYSVSKNDPIHTKGTDNELYEAIQRQIRACGVIIILAGVYSTYSKWINKEIEIAKKLRKPIIAVEPWGSERTSVLVKKSADKIVKWNSDSIIAVIKELD
jgi:hypothetical protein